MNIEIREAYDYPQEIRELFTEYTQMLIEGDATFKEYLAIQNYDQELADLKEKYDLPCGRLYILFADDKVAGCIGLKKLDDFRCEMKRLYVRPEFRGHHFSKILIERIIKEARKTGYITMMLDTLPFLKSAIHLYQEYGFYEVECYNNSPMDTSIYMRLDMREGRIHKIEQIAPNCYRISEADAVNCYLIAGSERALLIDTGYGIGNIKKVVKKLTSKPIDVVVTHYHPDHMGGVNWFPKFYVAKPDRALVYQILCTHVASAVMLPKGKKVSKQPYKSSKPVFVKENHVFHLGNREITVKMVPGHTRGSIVLLDAKEKIMFTGDDINACIWMQLPGCTTLKEWLVGGKTILDLAENYKAYSGHGEQVQSMEDMRKIFSIIKKLSREKNTLLPHIKHYPDKNTYPQVVYNSARKN